MAAELETAPGAPHREEPSSIPPDRDPEPAKGRASPLMRRQRLLLYLACATAVVSTAGMIASFQLKSPAEVAAEAEPPPATVITAPVQRKTLRRTVVFRGGFASTRTLSFTPSSVLDPSGDAGRPGGEMIVTKLPLRVGKRVRAGHLVAEVSYRPVIALHGRVPAIRDLVQGSSGPDVVQLQHALAEVGYGTGADESGRFGSGTAHAVRKLYAAVGYPVPTATAGRSNKPKDDGGTATGGPAAPAGRVSEKAKKLVQLPKSEVMYVPSFPALVTDIGAGVGSKVDKSLLKLTLGTLTLSGRLDPANEEAVKVGQIAKVLLEDTGREFTAKITKVGKPVQPERDGAMQDDGAQDGGTTGPYIPVTITGRHAWSTKLEGQEARITVSAATTDGAVLAVPLAAITAPADGRTSVTVLDTNGKRRRVRVTAGMSADGYVEVKPVDGRLNPGDAVVVGR